MLPLSFTTQITIVDPGQIIFKAMAPTSGQNFLMVFTFLESLYIILIIRFQFWSSLINSEFWLFCTSCTQEGQVQVKSKSVQIAPNLKSYYEYCMQGFQKCKNHQKIPTGSGYDSFQSYLILIYYSKLCSKILRALRQR